MAKDLEQLVLVMSADIRRMEKALNQAQGKFDKTARDIEKRQRELDKNLEKIGSGLGTALGRVSGVAAIAFGAITAYAIKAASDAGEIENAFNVAFGDMADDARAFARTFSQEVGRSFIETQEQMSRARLVLDGFGFSGDQALDVVKEIQARSVDIGSLFNVSDADAFRAIISGLTGETEPMKRFGVVVNETAVKAELLRLGFKGNATEASEQAKVIARLNLILKGTEKAQGDAANTADSFANQQKRLRGEVRDSAAEFGQRFLPVAGKVLDWANDALKAFNDLSPGMQNAGLMMLALVAAGGPIASLIGGLAKVIKYAVEARKAMLAVATANAAAGGTGLAAGAGTAAGAGLGAGGLLGAAVPVAGASALVLRGEAEAKRFKGLRGRAPDKLSAEELAFVEGAIQRRIDNAVQTGFYELGKGGSLTPTNRAGKAYRADVGQLIDLRGRVGAELARRGPAEDPLLGFLKGEADAAAAAATQGFGLTPEQLKPVNGKTKKGKSDAEKEAERLAKLALAQEDRTNALLGAANDQLLAARQAMAVEAEARLALELQAIDNERQARRADLDFAVEKKELTQAARDQVDAAEEAVRQQREANARAATAETKAREALAVRVTGIDNEIELLSLASGLATTAKERRAIELRILKLTEDRERAELEAIIASEATTAAEKEIARRKLATLEAGSAARQEGVKRETAGPLEAYLDDAIKSVGELNELGQQWAAEGLRDLAQGLAEAALAGEDFEDVVSNVFRRLAMQLVAQMLEQNVIAPAAKAGSQLISAGISAFMGGFGGGRAGGGDLDPRKWHIVGEKGPEILLPGIKGTVMPNSVLRAVSGLRPTAGQPRVTVLQPLTLDLKGAVMTEQLMMQMQTLARGAASTATAHALGQAYRGMPERLRRLDQLGT